MYKYAHHPLQAAMQGFLAVIIIIILDVCTHKIKCSHSDTGDSKKADYAGDIYLQLPSCTEPPWIVLFCRGAQRNLSFSRADLLDCPGYIVSNSTSWKRTYLQYIL